MKFSGNSDGGITSRTMKTPQIVIFGVLILMCAMGYFLVSYSSENRDLLSKYTSTMLQLRETTAKYTKNDRELKLSKASETSYQQSNRDLQHRIAEKEGEIAQATAERDTLENHFKDSQVFYLNVKDILGKSDDETFADTTNRGGTKSTYNALTKILQELKDNNTACGLLKGDLTKATERVQEIEGELTKSREHSIQVREEKKRLDDHILQMEETIDRLKTDHEARGLKSKHRETLSNIKMENLNKPLEDRHIIVEDRGTKKEKVSNEENGLDSDSKNITLVKLTQEESREVDRIASEKNKMTDAPTEESVVKNDKAEKKVIDFHDENEEEETNDTHATDNQKPDNDKEEEEEGDEGRLVTDSPKKINGRKPKTSLNRISVTTFDEIKRQEPKGSINDTIDYRGLSLTKF